MKKRILAFCLLACMLLGMLSMVGCKKSGTNAQANFVVPEGGFNPNETVEISFTHTMGAKLQDVLNDYIVEFNKIYPNIKITHTSAGGWSDINGNINTEIAAGTQPNIAYCYPDHVAMYNIANAVVTLDNLIASDLAIEGTEEILGLTQAQRDDFIEAYYQEGTVFNGDGLMYTMPLNKSTEVLYYNKTFFEEHNLTVPSTWEELWAVCAQIKAIDSDCYPLGYDAEDNWFITLCEQMKTGYTSATGDHFLFDNDANKEIVKELRGYYEKGYFTTQELYKGYTSALFTETTDKNCYMCVGSSGGASYQMSNNDTTDGSFAFEVGVAPIPQADANNKKVISQGPSLCILKGTDTTDQQIMASWLFVKFLCTNIDFQAEFSMASGYMPVLKSVTEIEAYAKWLGEANGYEKLVAQCVKVGIEGRDNYFVSPAFNGSSKARVQVGNLMLKVIAGSIPSGKDLDSFIDDAFRDALEECEY